MYMSITISETESLKAGLKATWMTGDYGYFAKHLEPSAEEFVSRLALAPGSRMLDVACGSGNLAVPAARAGATVTGVDIAANSLKQGRERAKSEGLAVQFDEGDAEQLPYDDAAFDVVVSMFGAMFAPRPELVAAELMRVCRPGGQIVMANWTSTGFVGRMFKAVRKHVSPPLHTQPPTLWGDEAVVSERLHNGIARLQMTKRMYSFKYPFPPSAVVEFFRIYYGPTHRAFAVLDVKGQASLRHDLRQLWSEHNCVGDNSTHVESEYLEVIATRS